MPREYSNRDYYPEGRSHRETINSRDYEYESSGARRGDVDPEFDARNYRLLKAKQERALERQRLAKEQQRQGGGGGAAAVADKEQLDYDDYQMMKERRKHKKKKKRRRGAESDDKRAGRKSNKVLVEYDDVSSGSEVYSDSPASGSQSLSHHSHHTHSSSHRTSGRSRVSPPPDKRRRAPSPGSAIQEYKKEIMSRSHSSSPAHVSRDRSPSSRSSTKPRKSHRVTADVTPLPKGSVPKAYAEPPKAYRTGDGSPIASRSRHRLPHSRSPSPRTKKYSSPVSPHRYFFLS